MSLLRRIFAGKTFEEELAAATASFNEGHFGEAKLSYERALDKAKEQSDAERDELRSKIDACCDAIAAKRLDEAERFIKGGQLDFAQAEIQGALEIARGDQAQERAEALMLGMEKSEAVENAAISPEVTDEELLTAIAGSWEEDQAEEYDRYGDEFMDAMLLLHNEDGDGARTIFTRLLQGDWDDPPRYLHLELGRAHFVAKDNDAGERSLRAFIESMGPDEGGAARLAAHIDLARLCEDRGDEEKAIEELSAAIDAMDKDPRPYVALGQYMRTKGYAKEALEVLTTALDLMDDVEPHWRVYQEVGLAQKEVGNAKEALSHLEMVVSTLTARQHYDLPPATAVALAELYEQDGRVERAADMYRTLCDGSDVDNHLKYHREAQRLLEAAGLDEQAKLMAARAEALAGDNAHSPEQTGHNS